ncbi:MAG TPA: hypothetical protein VIX91_14860, partial [Candidatus Acidoferrum sp.]
EKDERPGEHVECRLLLGGRQDMRGRSLPVTLQAPASLGEWIECTKGKLTRPCCPKHGNYVLKEATVDCYNAREKASGYFT